MMRENAGRSGCADRRGGPKQTAAESPGDVMLIIRLKSKKPTQKEAGIPQTDSNRHEHRACGKQCANRQPDAAGPE